MIKMVNFNKVVFWLPYKIIFTVTVLNSETQTKKKAKITPVLEKWLTFFRNCTLNLKKKCYVNKTVDIVGFIC
jgi:hypothetical protein